jgi:hypothetical protein
MIWIFLAFGANFISCWFRSRILNADPDPGDKSNADPDPKHCFSFTFLTLFFLLCFLFLFFPPKWRRHISKTHTVLSGFWEIAQAWRFAWILNVPCVTNSTVDAKFEHCAVEGETFLINLKFWTRENVGSGSHLQPHLPAIWRDHMKPVCNWWPVYTKHAYFKFLQYCIFLFFVLCFLSAFRRCL